jgi:hypothetical protein
MPQVGMDDEIRRSKMMSDGTWGYQAWCKKVGKKQMGDAAAIIQERLQTFRRKNFLHDSIKGSRRRIFTSA